MIFFENVVKSVSSTCEKSLQYHLYYTDANCLRVTEMGLSACTSNQIAPCCDGIRDCGVFRCQMEHSWGRRWAGERRAWLIHVVQAPLLSSLNLLVSLQLRLNSIPLCHCIRGRRPCTQTNLGLNAYFIIERIAERLSGGGGLKGLGFWDSWAPFSDEDAAAE